MSKSIFNGRHQDYRASGLWQIVASRGPVHVIRCADPAEIVRSLRTAPDAPKALWIDTPVDLPALVALWSGVGPTADERAAEALLDQARSVLRIEYSAGSAIERRWQIDAAAEAAATETADIARLLLVSSEGGDSVEAVRRGVDALGSSPIEQFQRLSKLLGPRLPPIVIQFSRSTDRWVASIGLIAHAVELTPEARLVIAIGPNEWEQLRLLLDPHTAAVLENGLIDLVDVAAPCEARPDAPMPIGTFEELHRRARVATEAARCVEGPRSGRDDPPEFGEARSLAEALLFAALQADPRTAGLFALNADGGFTFGSRLAEIDLLCMSLRIAIEVDGYFHFQDNDAYRRDRAKDWAMQCHGLLVLRFLAEDVSDRLSEVMQRIVDAVSQHRGS